MDQQAIYLEMYKEWRTHVRHHETQRSSITGFCLAFAGIMGKVVQDYYVQNNWFGIGMVGDALILMGATAALLNQKQYERIRSALENADMLSEAIDLLPSSNLSDGAANSCSPLECDHSSIMKMRRAAFENHKLEFPRLAALRLHHVFVVLPLIVCGIGCLLAGCSLWKWSIKPWWSEIGIAVALISVVMSMWFWQSRKLRKTTDEMDGVRLSKNGRTKLSSFDFAQKG